MYLATFKVLIGHVIGHLAELSLIAAALRGRFAGRLGSALTSFQFCLTQLVVLHLGHLVLQIF